MDAAGCKKRTVSASFAFAVLALAVCANPMHAQQLVDPELRVTPYVTGLQQPTGFVFLPTAPGAPLELLVIEKATGHVVHVRDGVVQATVLDLPVNSVSERGLLGIALHPAHATNAWVYLYFTESSTGEDSFNSGEVEAHRVDRYAWTGIALVGRTNILTLPVTPGPNHDGGIILFGPDDKLYGVIGDLNRNGQLQNFPLGSPPDDTSIIFRVEDDGSDPSDNPFSPMGGAMRKVYAYGIRNSFGLDFDPLTQVLWQTENGPNRMDELNRVVPGFNSGWEPLIGPDSQDPSSVDDLWNITGSTYADPLFSWRTPIGVTTVHFVRTGVLGAAYTHDLLVGDSNHGSVYRFEPSPDRTDVVLPTPETMDRVADTAAERTLFLFGSGFGTVTDIDTGPDGVYVCSIFGTIHRVSRAPTSVSRETWSGVKSIYRPRER